MLLQINLLAVFLLTIVVVYQFVVMTTATSKAGEALEKANRVMKVIHLKTQDELDELAQKTDNKFNDLNSRVTAKELCADTACLKKDDIIKMKTSLGMQLPANNQDIVPPSATQEPSDATNTIQYQFFNTGFLPSDVLARPYCCVNAENKYLRHSQPCETLKATCNELSNSVCTNDTMADFCEWKNNTCVNRTQAPVFTARVPCDQPDPSAQLPIVKTSPSTSKPVFYTEFERKGTSIQLGIGEYRDLSVTHPFLFNAIKSLDMNADWVVEVFTGKNFTGYSAKFRFPASYNLVPMFAGKVKSMNITRLATFDTNVTPSVPPTSVTQTSKVRLFTDVNQKGDYIDLAPDNYGDLEKALPKFYNNIKSLTLPHDLEITFYKGKNYSSSSIRFSYPASYDLSGLSPFPDVGSISIKRKPLVAL